MERNTIMKELSDMLKNKTNTCKFCEKSFDSKISFKKHIFFECDESLKQQGKNNKVIVGNNCIIAGDNSIVGCNNNLINNTFNLNLDLKEHPPKIPLNNNLELFESCNEKKLNNISKKAILMFFLKEIIKNKNKNKCAY